MKNCSICRINPESESIVFIDEKTILWQSMEVDLPGYFIIAPRRHVESYSQLTDDEGTSIFKMTARIDHVLKEHYQVIKLYLCCFSELTPHLHFHLFPRYSWMDTINEAQTEYGIDGSALFSYVREHYQIQGTEANIASLQQFVRGFKSRI